MRTLIENSKPASITDSSTGVAAAATAFMPVAPTDVIDATANAEAVSALVQTAYSSGSYIPGDVVATNEDTGTEPTFTVVTTKVHSATTDASGSVGNDGNWIVTGTTGVGTKWTGTAATTSGTLGAVTLTSGGSYTTNPTLSGEPVTLTPNGGGAAGPATGYTVTNTMGVNTVAVKTSGSVSVIHSNPITTAAAVGSGASGLTLNVTWEAGVLYSLVNTALTALSSAEGGLGKSLNLVAAYLGLPAMTFNLVGGSAGTVGAVTQSEVALTPSAGATAADYVTAVAAMILLRNNMSTLIRFFNQLLVATGFLPIPDATGGSPWNSAIPSPGVPPYGADPNLFSAGSNDQPWQVGTFNQTDRGQGPQPRNCRVLYLFQWRELARPSPGAACYPRRDPARQGWLRAHRHGFCHAEPCRRDQAEDRIGGAQGCRVAYRAACNRSPCRRPASFRWNQSPGRATRRPGSGRAGRRCRVTRFSKRLRRGQGGPTTRPVLLSVHLSCMQAIYSLCKRHPGSFCYRRDPRR